MSLLQEKWYQYSKVHLDDETIIQNILNDAYSFFGFIFRKIEDEYQPIGKMLQREKMLTIFDDIEEERKYLDELEVRKQDIINNMQDVQFLKYLAIELLKKVDFQYFNASLIYAVTFEDFDTLDENLLHAEKDDYNDDDKEKYGIALKNARYIYVAKKCFNTILNATEDYGYSSNIPFKQVEQNLKLYTKIKPKQWNRIWKRAFDYNELVDC